MDLGYSGSLTVQEGHGRGQRAERSRGSWVGGWHGITHKQSHAALALALLHHILRPRNHQEAHACPPRDQTLRRRLEPRPSPNDTYPASRRNLTDPASRRNPTTPMTPIPKPATPLLCLACFGAQAEAQALLPAVLSAVCGRSGTRQTSRGPCHCSTRRLRWAGAWS